MSENEILGLILEELKSMNEKLDYLVGYQVIDHEETEEVETYMDGTPV